MQRFPKCISLDLTGTVFHYRGKLKEYLSLSANKYLSSSSTGNCSNVPPLEAYPNGLIESAFRDSYKRMQIMHPIFGLCTGLDVKQWYTGVITEVLREKLPDVPTELTTDEAINAMSSEMFQVFASSSPYELFEDSIEALRGFKQRGLKLAALSNADERYLTVMDELGIREFFDVVCLSHMCGLQKPDPAFFRFMQTACGIKDAQDILHVDDNLKNYLVAKQMGFQAVFIVRYRGHEQAESFLTERDVVIQGLDELLPMLDSTSRSFRSSV